MAKKEADKEETPETEAPSQDSPLLDLSDAAVRALIKRAKKRGYVTHEEINNVLPSEQVDGDQIEDVLAMFSEMGINVVDNEENETEEAEEPAAQPEEEEAESGDLVEATSARTPARSENAKEPTDRTDDPVRMYLREMGTVELLSREGEIAIAKRGGAAHPWRGHPGSL